MNVNIQAKGFLLTPALQEHTLRRLQFAFHFANDDMRQIVVRLSDVNGPRGGKDKRCQIQLRLVNEPDLTIADTEDDLYVAIDRAIERGKRAFHRKLDRKRALATHHVSHHTLLERST